MEDDDDDDDEQAEEYEEEKDALFDRDGWEETEEDDEEEDDDKEENDEDEDEELLFFRILSLAAAYDTLNRGESEGRERAKGEEFVWGIHCCPAVYSVPNDYGKMSGDGYEYG